MIKKDTPKDYENKNNKEKLNEAIGKLIAGCLVVPFVFQFVLWRFIHRDIPWYMDLWAGLFIVEDKFTSRILGLLWIGTLVASYCGFEYPFFKV